MRVARRVPYDELSMPGVFVGFVGGNPALDDLLPRCASSVAELIGAARARRDYDAPEETRARVAETMRRQAQAAGAGTEVFEEIDRFARPGTLAIVTGQQPALFGGPLYVFHKIATALHLARLIREVPDAPEVVTLFWNHSEDHDWGEANHGFFVNPALDVQRVRLRQPTTGKPLWGIEVGDDVRKAVDEVRDLMPQTDAGCAELDALRCEGDATLGELQTELLYRHFGRHGLLVLEPTGLGEELRAPLVEFHERAEELRSATKSIASELVDRGFDVTVDPESPYTFEITADGKRRGVPDGEPAPAAAAASPGALLRSVWQDRILPTLTYVAGPGEVAYLALSGGLYQHLDVPRPPLVPRVSLTHADARQVEQLERFALRLDELEVGPRLIEARLVEGEAQDGSEEGIDARPEDELLGLAEDFAKRVRQAEIKVAEVDPSLVHSLARIGSRTQSELRKFVQKLGNQRRNLAGRYRQHARRLCNELMPRGRLQERVLTPLPFIARRGESFCDELIAISSPFEREHLIVVDQELGEADERSGEAASDVRGGDAARVDVPRESKADEPRGEAELSA